MKTFSSETFWI